MYVASPPQQDRQPERQRDPQGTKGEPVVLGSPEEIAQELETEPPSVSVRFRSLC
jgi:hypothetical protein